MPTPTEIKRAAKRRAKTLEIIRRRITSGDLPPTLTEIAEATGVSKRTAAVDLERLVEAGAIERLSTPRGIKIRDVEL